MDNVDGSFFDYEKRNKKKDFFWRVESMCFNIDKNLNVFCPKSLAATACHYAFF